MEPPPLVAAEVARLNDSLELVWRGSQQQGDATGDGAHSKIIRYLSSDIEWQRQEAHRVTQVSHELTIMLERAEAELKSRTEEALRARTNSRHADQRVIAIARQQHRWPAVCLGNVASSLA